VLDQTSSKETEKEDWQVSQNEGLQERFRKSEGAGATMHQVYSVMARAGPEEWILD